MNNLLSFPTKPNHRTPVAVAGVLFFLALCFAVPAVRAQQEPSTPGQGSAERKEITDALRVPVEKKLKQRVVFKIDHLQVQDNWAFLQGVPRSPKGDRIDYRRTPYAEPLRLGMFDDGIVALLHKTNKRWRIVQYVIGSTDVPYVDWDQKYHAPSAIFPH